MEKQLNQGSTKGRGKRIVCIEVGKGLFAVEVDHSLIVLIMQLHKHCTSVTGKMLQEGRQEGTIAAFNGAAALRC